MATGTKKSIKELYDEGMAEVDKIVGSLDATPDQRDAAMQAAKKLSSMLSNAALQSIENRTALLSALIDELNEVIGSIQTNSPLKGVTENLTAVLTRAQALLDAEK